jgi:hypothetical protein
MSDTVQWIAINVHAGVAAVFEAAGTRVDAGPAQAERRPAVAQLADSSAVERITHQIRAGASDVGEARPTQYSTSAQTA